MGLEPPRIPRAPPSLPTGPPLVYKNQHDLWSGLGLAAIILTPIIWAVIKMLF